MTSRLLGSFPFIFLAAVGFLSEVQGQTPPSPAQDSSFLEDLLERERLTGDWWGLRTDLEDHGITIDGHALLEWTAVLDGGVRRQGSLRNLVSFDLDVDLEKLIGLPRTSAFLQFAYVNPESGGSRDTGDIQVHSNIEADVQLNDIFELWIEHRAWEDRLRLKVGKIDANSEFAFAEVAGDFSHSSAGLSPTVFAMPTYPDSAMGFNLFAEVLRDDENDLSLTLGYAIYDGALAVDGVPTGRRGPASFFDDEFSDDHIHFGQLELLWNTDELRSASRGRASLGIWHHDGDFARFDGGMECGTTGFFLTVEQRLTTFGPDEAGSLIAFLQAGLADDAVSDVGGHLAGGLVIEAPFEDRPADRAGIYASWAALSDEPMAGFSEDEIAFDLYYRFQLTPWSFVQPELMFIANPGGGGTLDDAWLFGLRFGIDF